MMLFGTIDIKVKVMRKKKDGIQKKFKKFGVYTVSEPRICFETWWTSLYYEFQRSIIIVVLPVS